MTKREPPSTLPETIQAAPTPEALRVARELSAPGLRTVAALVSLVLKGEP